MRINLLMFIYYAPKYTFQLYGNSHLFCSSKVAAKLEQF